MAWPTYMILHAHSGIYGLGHGFFHDTQTAFERHRFIRAAKSTTLHGSLRSKKIDSLFVLTPSDICLYFGDGMSKGIKRRYIERHGQIRREISAHLSSRGGSRDRAKVNY